jgi:16S rRNA (guanine(966)-N(2))-methyltransferase RsmD
MQTKRTSPRSPGKPAGAPRQVRIIGGQWKRTTLAVLEADGLRPTPDRVRETVFNWLEHFFEREWSRIHCLDLFAGTGALGFEAASRGAAQVVMVESNPAAVRQLDVIRARLKAGQVQVQRGDALSVCRTMAAKDASDRFVLIFLDPPYHQDWLIKILPLCEQLLTGGGLVYAEAESPLTSTPPPSWLEGWEVVRADKAGMVFHHLLRRKM